MEVAVITAVGIDVSKSKSTVAVRRPCWKMFRQWLTTRRWRS